MDIVINRCFGGFGLSIAACKRYEEITGTVVAPPYSEDSSAYSDGSSSYNRYFDGDEYRPGVVYYGDIPRDDPVLVLIVRELGLLVNTKSSALKVVKIPDNVHWTITSNDGMEQIEEVHRSWS